MPKNVKSKPAGKYAVKAGPSGKMHGFTGVGTQTPDKTAVSPTGTGVTIVKGGGSGKMQGFTPVKAVKKA